MVKDLNPVLRISADCKIVNEENLDPGIVSPPFTSIKLPPKVEYSSIIIPFSGDARLSPHSFCCLLFEVNTETAVLHELYVFSCCLPLAVNIIIVDISRIRIIFAIINDSPQPLKFQFFHAAAIASACFTESFIYHTSVPYISRDLRLSRLRLYVFLLSITLLTGSTLPHVPRF